MGSAVQHTASRVTPQPYHAYNSRMSSDYRLAVLLVALAAAAGGLVARRGDTPKR